MVLVSAIFLGLTVWCWRSCCAGKADGLMKHALLWFRLPQEGDFLIPAFALALALMLLFSPHYPWYLAWLVPFLALVPSFTVFVYVCGFFYMCTTALAVGDGPRQFLLNEIVYAALMFALIVETGIRAVRLRSTE